MSLKKKISFGLCSLMTAGMFTFAQAAENPQVIATVDGWSKVLNANGPTLGFMPTSGVKIISKDGKFFKDLNRNGKLDKFEDWRLSPQKRAEDLAKQLSIEQIAGLFDFAINCSISPILSLAI